MPLHPYTEKYNPDNYQPEVYDFLADFSSIELAYIKQISEEIEPTYEEEPLHLLAQLVHDKYSFKKFKYGDSVLDPSAIKEGDVDCYGYTLVLSQMLSHVNINHSVAFANTHAFILANSGDPLDCNYYLLDALSPEISGKINDESICHKDCIQNEYFAINMETYLNNTIDCNNLEQFLLTHPWTHFKNKQEPANATDRSSKQNIYAKLFSPEDGTKILYAYDELRQSIANINLSRAYLLSKFVTQNYPEIDIRNKPYTMQTLIKKLGELGLSELASLTIDRTANARQIKGMVSHCIWQSNEYKKLGLQTGKPEFLAIAQALLEEALNNKDLSCAASRLLASKLSKLLI